MLQEWPEIACPHYMVCCYTLNSCHDEPGWPPVSVLIIDKNLAFKKIT